MSEPVRMPLADAARVLGTTPDALRQKIKRGKLQAVRDNSGRLLVWVDSDTLPTVELSSRSVDIQSEHPNSPSSHVKSLEDHVKSLTARLDVADRQADHLRADHKAELDRLQAAWATEVARILEERARLEDELQEARVEADHAKADQLRMARDVTTMFDELRTMADRYSKMHADQARLQAELEQARRPWWQWIMRK